MGYDFDKCQEQYEGGLGGRDLELVKLWAKIKQIGGYQHFE
jgi:hypothetical protein